MWVEDSHGWHKCRYGFWSPKNPQVCRGVKPATLVVSFNLLSPLPPTRAHTAVTSTQSRYASPRFLSVHWLTKCLARRPRLNNTYVPRHPIGSLTYLFSPCRLCVPR